MVIIGGGVMGASAAFHLAEAGVRDIDIELGSRSPRAYREFAHRPEARSEALVV